MGELSSIGFKESFVASGNLIQFRFVRLGGDDVYLADSGFADGVVQNHPNDNEHATVVVLGPTKIQLSNSYGSGILVGCGSGGYAVMAQGGTTVNEGRKYGTLLQGATSGAYGVLNFCQVGST